MRLNLFQYSLPSETLALSHENSAGLDQLRADLHKEHQPINTTEELLVNEMAEQYWRLRRARVMETDLLASGQTVITHLAAMQRMMSSAERGFHKALSALRQLQKDRGSRSEPALAHGFVPQNLTQEPDTQVGQTILSSANESDQTRDLACQGTSALAREGATPPAANSGSRSGSASALGFVPPPCPTDEDIDPADWARAFQMRHKVHAKLAAPVK